MALFLALAVLSLLALAVAAVFATRRFLALLREARAVAGALGESLDRIEAAAERAAAQGERLGPAVERLEHSLERLSRSKARLDVLLTAYADARAALGAFVFVPRK